MNKQFLRPLNEEASPLSSKVQNEPSSASRLIAEQSPKTLNVTPKTHSASVNLPTSTNGYGAAVHSVSGSSSASQNCDGVVSSTAEAQLSMNSTKLPLSNEMTSRKELLSLNMSRRVLTEFLNYFNLTSTPRSMSKKSSGPRVLTSAESIVMLEAKEKQKKDEQEAKELGKKGREEKKENW